MRKGRYSRALESAAYNLDRSKDHFSAWRENRRTGGGPWNAFNRAWFIRHQDKLLRAVNHPILKYPMRDALCISADKDEWVSGILPGGYTTLQGVTRGGYTHAGRFFTHARMAKRLYFAFKPVWWAIHHYDSFFADRFAPALSFGLDTLTAYSEANPETSMCDGYCAMSAGGDTWANKRDVTPSVVTLVTTGSTYSPILSAHTTTNYWNSFGRMFWGFDTTTLGSGASISAASIVITSNGSALDDWGSQTWHLCSFVEPAAPDNAVASDCVYTKFGTSDLASNYGSLSTWPASGSTFTLTLNASGITNINKGAVSWFGWRTKGDRDNVAPTWVSGNFTRPNHRSTDYTGSADDPYLYITYTISSPLTAVHHYQMQRGY